MKNFRKLCTLLYNERLFRRFANSSLNSYKPEWIEQDWPPTDEGQTPLKEEFYGDGSRDRSIPQRSIHQPYYYNNESKGVETQSQRGGQYYTRSVTYEEPQLPEEREPVTGGELRSYLGSVRRGDTNIRSPYVGWPLLRFNQRRLLLWVNLLLKGTDTSVSERKDPSVQSYTVRTAVYFRHIK